MMLKTITSTETNRIPFIAENDLIAKADAFAKKYNPNNTLPVPIEEILEISQDLGFFILPVPELTEALIKLLPFPRPVGLILPRTDEEHS